MYFIREQNTHSKLCPNTVTLLVFACLYLFVQAVCTGGGNNPITTGIGGTGVFICYILVGNTQSRIVVSGFFHKSFYGWLGYAKGEHSAMVVGERYSLLYSVHVEEAIIVDDELPAYSDHIGVGRELLLYFLLNSTEAKWHHNLVSVYATDLCVVVVSLEEQYVIEIESINLSA